MIPTMERPSVRRPATRPAALRVVRVTDPTRGGERTPKRPTWWVLYGIALLTVGAVFAAEAVPPEGLARTLSVLAAVLGGVALIRLWIGCNRWHLVHPEERDNPAGLGKSHEASSIQEVG